MSRQVDIKAIVSHVVRGDGINKCRICMGDTSEGQVFLGDTVLMDGDQPVTLSELLETITGVQMPINEDLPVNLCSLCSDSALSAADFRAVCRQAARKWESIVQLLTNLPQHVTDTKSLFAVLEEDQMVLVTDYDRMSSTRSAAHRLTRKTTPMEETESDEKSDERKHRYQCPDCGKKFIYVHQMYRHLKESTDFKRACYICAKIMRRDELVIHLTEEHNRKPYDCKKCPALLPSYSQYVQHLRKAHSQGACTCGDCGRSFKNSNSFRAHLSVHSIKCCPSCDKLFRNQTCYLYHVKKCCNLQATKAHKGAQVEVKNKWSDKKIKVGMRGRTDKECICDYCNKKFSGKKFISAHIQIVHMKNTHSPCAYCGKFLAAAHMTEHVKKHQDLSFKCEHCGICLRTRLGYNQHLRLHSGEKPYTCRYCAETFSASSRRSEHIRKVHKSFDIVLRHACDRCPAKFRLPYMLKKHMSSVHSTDDGHPLFECYECHEKFSSCRALLRHGRVHRKHMVEEAKGLPRGVCTLCTDSALAATRFRNICLESAKQWSQATSCLTCVSPPLPEEKTFFVLYNKDVTIFKDQNRVSSALLAVNRLNNILQVPTEAKKTPFKRQKPLRKGSPWKCRYCGEKFRLLYSLNLHLRMTTERACTHCGVVVQKEKLHQHLQKSHDIRLFPCKVCHKLFKEEIELYRHTQTAHGVLSHSCGVCKQGFVNERALRTHRYAHALFNCLSCNASFENLRCYRYHAACCRGSKRPPDSMYECDDCGNKYVKKDSLRTHIQNKHLNILPFVCQKCGKRSSTLAHHRMHETVHAAERKVFQCHCGAKLTTELGFNLHQRIHSGEKPYQCRECGKSFLSASRRLDHMKRRHMSTEDMPHKCMKCSARFIRPSLLKKHCKVVHGVPD